MTWSIDHARDNYSLAHWSNGYFDIDAKGDLICRPNPDRPDQSVSLAEIVQEVSGIGFSLPVLVRFSGILRHRLVHLTKCFARSITTHNYRGSYTPIYPIKVNQQSSVVDALLAEKGVSCGLEAGSKPELLSILARSKPGGVVVCNGYKDPEYIRYALMGLTLGHPVYVVLEKTSELAKVIKESRGLEIKPLLGIRIRLASLGDGKWQNTGGEKSKFGLSARDVLDVIEHLREENMLECLRMMHFHMGSQIANLQDIQTGANEASHYFAELQSLGAPINVVNVGGGLGVDYEGTRSRSFCSINYTMQDYSTTIVEAFASVCRLRGLTHPNIFSESGRALTAHHAVLLMNVIDVEPAPGQEALAPPSSNDCPVVQSIWRAREDLGQRPPFEVYHDIAHWLKAAQSLFQDGKIRLSDRARVEQIYYATCVSIRSQLTDTVRAHRESVDDLNEKLADKYFCNYSLFQSTPDHWALDQIFPIVPLRRLDEEPTRRAILQDITCDSDGRVNAYVNRQAIEQSVALHEISNVEPYLLGIFMVGAYQEILGDMHNLFGSPHSVHIEIQEDGGFRVESVQCGNTVESVLHDVHYDGRRLLKEYRSKLDFAADISVEKRVEFLSAFEKGFQSYTYLEWG